MSQEYVAGFAFSEGMSKVALVRKNRPSWQCGKLNAVGGHVEPGESPVEAMRREFKEETGGDWPQDGVLFAKISEDGDFSVFFFAARLPNVYSLTTTTDEQIEIVDLDKGLPASTIENLPWLIPLAVDVLCDGRPGFAEITYPKR